MSAGLAATSVALIATLTLTPLVVHVLRRWHVVDVPNARSSHDRPTVRGGGWAPLAGATIALAVVAPVPASLRWLILVVAVALGGLGFVDDLRPLSPAVRLSATVILVAASLGFALDRPLGLVAGVGSVVAALLVAAYVNAFNFMDGINGISALQAVVVGVALSAGGNVANVDVIVVAGLAIAAAAAGFLPFNFPSAVVFLGDVGSYGIGGWIGVLGVIAATEVSPVLPAALAAVYGADTAATVVRRLRRGERIWVSHREHSYQRLCRAGWTHAASAVTVTVFTAVCGLLGLAASRHGFATGVIGLALVTVVCVLYLSLPAFVERRSVTQRRVSVR